jgi:hypothetical protein
VGADRGAAVKTRWREPFEGIDIPALVRRMVSPTGFSVNPVTNRCDICRRVIKTGDWPYCPHAPVKAEARR